MVDTPSVSFDRPIPGQSLTSELGNAPWQQPPQYSTVEEALEFYIPRLTNQEFLDNLFDVMETGIPLTTIASAMQSSGVMSGKHSLDVGILIIPVLVETMAYLADESEVEYKLGSGMGIDNSKPTDTRIALATKMAKEKLGEETEEAPTVEEPSEEPEEKPMGLMSRRSEDVV